MWFVCYERGGWLICFGGLYDLLVLLGFLSGVERRYFICGGLCMHVKIIGAAG